MTLDRQTVTITRLGAQGDGLVDGVSPPLAVPFALPGEIAEIEVSGAKTKLHAISVPNANRVTPPCRHFTHCGGCSMQHLAEPAIAEWKRQLVIAAFQARGLIADIRPTVGPHGKRRRAVFAAERQGNEITLGFHAAASHDLVDLEMCTVLDPTIVAAMPGLRELLTHILPRKQDARVTVTVTRGGLDVAVDEIKRELTANVRTDIARGARALALARVSVNGDPGISTSEPMLRFGRADVLLAPGCFVQAVREAEIYMAEAISAAVGKAKSVADLFCGLGAFTFPLSERAKVSAFDSDVTAITALVAAAKQTQGIKPITATRRDLMREPLSTVELRDFDAVVFDPPRAGAEAQARMLAKSKVKTVVAVSCNPATLARDARILVDGGYAIESITPIDQFQFTHHVEALAVFKR